MPATPAVSRLKGRGGTLGRSHPFNGTGLRSRVPRPGTPPPSLPCSGGRELCGIPPSYRLDFGCCGEIRAPYPWTGDPGQHGPSQPAHSCLPCPREGCASSSSGQWLGGLPGPRKHHPHPSANLAGPARDGGADQSQLQSPTSQSGNGPQRFCTGPTPSFNDAETTLRGWPLGQGHAGSQG
uniref:Uncharacterized protein n=1 Tax=Mustela putorius furo TaxID=9669 RepID=M3YMZ1_MUSPF